MIGIDLALDEAGLLVACGVQGHAQAGPKGNDVVCAAVSVLTKTALRVLSLQEGIRVQGGAERGVFQMELEYAPQGRDFLFAAGMFLREGLEAVAAEYPDHCTVTITTERRGYYGSKTGRQRR
ncbi:MAG: ribosomal-processing cysteine protease Prp [Treponema sp.]|nr:ribosomal-processing cysteine protease Prp [Treponema sp.]